jgi:tyramine---L-glutamate ligase
MTTIFVYEHLCAIKAGVDAASPLAFSLWREGRAMLDAVLADFRALPNVTTTVAESGGESEFRALAAQADFSLVIAPECDGVLEERCRWVEDAGGRLLGPTSAAVRLTADKLALAPILAAAASTPRTWPLGAEPGNLYPRVWKPRYGAGSQDTYLVDGPAAAATARSELAKVQSEMIAQDYIAGIAASVAFLIGPSSSLTRRVGGWPDVRIALQPCFQRLSSDGRFHYLGGSLPIPDHLARRAVAVADRALEAVPGLRGYVGVDLALGADERHDCVIEINPRLTTSYIGLRRAARFNIAEAMLRIVAGQSVPELSWNRDEVQFDVETSD